MVFFFDTSYDQFCISHRVYFLGILSVFALLRNKFRRVAGCPFEGFLPHIVGSTDPTLHFSKCLANDSCADT